MPNSKAFGLLIAALLIGASMSVTAAVPPYNGSPAYDVMMHSPYDFSGNPVAADEPPWHAFFEAPATPAISPGFEYTDTQDLTQLSNFDLLYMQQGEADALSGGDMETVRAWTQAGGILVILVTTPQTSALGAYFGPAYEFTSTGDPDGNNISVTDPGASILNVPNALDDVSLSNWGSSVHGALASTGGAYHCVADDSESGVPESALPVLCTAPRLPRRPPRHSAGHQRRFRVLREPRSLST